MTRRIWKIGLLSLLLIGIFPLFDSNYQFISTIEGYVSHGPIEIANDAELASVATSGDGSLLTPYIIEGWDISTKFSDGIYIHDTFAYFEIRNCRIKTGYQNTGIYFNNIYNGTSRITENIIEGNGFGIHVSNSVASTISNNYIRASSTTGIYVTYSHATVVVNNTLEGNSNGIRLSSSDYSVVQNNTVTNYRSYGIYLLNTNHSDVYNNTAINGYCGINIYRSEYTNITKNFAKFNDVDGIFLSESPNSSIVNNTCQNNDNGLYITSESIINSFIKVERNICNNNSYYGIYMIASPNSLMENNTCNFNGYYGAIISSCQESIITNNTLNYNLRMGLYIGSSISLVISFNNITMGGIIFNEYLSLDTILGYSVIGNRVNDQPYGFFTNLTNFEINTSYGQLTLVNCTNGKIRNQNCSYLYNGIQMLYGSELQLTNNSCSNNQYYGIRSYNTHQLEIYNSTCNNNLYRGISVYYGNKTALVNNICNNNQYEGIYVVSISGAKNDSIINNSCNFNYYGMFLSSSKNSTIANNSCHYNTYDGMRLSSSDFGLFDNNSLFNNGNNGMYFQNCDSPTIINNRLSGCGFQASEYTMDQYRSYNFTDNQVNGLPFGFFTDLNNFSISGQYGQLIILNCTDGIIENQNFTSIYKGISIHDSSHLEIMNNTFINNKYTGIYTEYSDYLTVRNNIFQGNNIGLDYRYSSLSNITHNLFVENLRSVYCLSSFFNLFHHNSFIFNNEGASQALCTGGTLNVWFDKVSNEGNYYWPHWNETLHYEIAGSENAIDPSLLSFYDYDSDGIPDKDEYLMELCLYKDDSSDDLDSDNLTNYEEFSLGLNASNADTDGDSMFDGWEVQVGLDPTFDDSSLDFDFDGCSNVYEYNHALNSSNSDTDYDLMPDGWEVSMSLNPLINDANSDNDFDNMSNIWEYQMNLNASFDDSLSDYDKDHLNNIQEFNLGLNATNPDTDNDGFSDFIEVNAGTNPLDNTDYPEICNSIPAENTTNTIETTMTTTEATTTIQNTPAFGFIGLFVTMCVYLTLSRLKNKRKA